MHTRLRQEHIAHVMHNAHVLGVSALTKCMMRGMPMVFQELIHWSMLAIGRCALNDKIS